MGPFKFVRELEDSRRDGKYPDDPPGRRGFFIPIPNDDRMTLSNIGGVVRSGSGTLSKDSTYHVPDIEPGLYQVTLVFKRREFGPRFKFRFARDLDDSGNTLTLSLGSADYELIADDLKVVSVDSGKEAIKFVLNWTVKTWDQNCIQYRVDDERTAEPVEILEFAIAKVQDEFASVGGRPAPRKADDKLFFLSVGQSGFTGINASDTFDFFGADAGLPNMFEFSRGVDRPNYAAATAGEVQPLLAPEQKANMDTSVTPMFHVAKTLARILPDSEIYIQNANIGNSSFDDGTWEASGAHVQAEKALLLASMAQVQGAKLGGILVSLGYDDGRVDMPVATFRTKLTELINEFRDLFGYTVPVYVLGLSPFAQISDGIKAIAEDQRDVAMWLDDSHFVPTDVFTGTVDNIHANGADNRSIGQVLGRTIADTLMSARPLHRLEYNDATGKFKDVESGALILTQQPTDQGADGFALSTDGSTTWATGTTLRIPGKEYTVTCLMEVTAAVGGFGDLLSAGDFKCSPRVVRHPGGSPLLPEDFASLALNTLFRFTIAAKDGTARVWFDTDEQQAFGANDFPAIATPTQVNLFSPDGSAAGDGPYNVYDLQVFDYAIEDEQLADLVAGDQPPPK